MPSSVQLCSRRMDSWEGSGGGGSGGGSRKRAKSTPPWQLAWEDPATWSEEQLHKVAQWYRELDPKEAREDAPVEKILAHILRKMFRKIIGANFAQELLNKSWRKFCARFFEKIWAYNPKFRL